MVTRAKKATFDLQYHKTTVPMPFIYENISLIASLRRVSLGYTLHNLNRNMVHVSIYLFVVFEYRGYSFSSFLHTILFQEVSIFRRRISVVI